MINSSKNKAYSEENCFKQSRFASIISVLLACIVALSITCPSLAFADNNDSSSDVQVSNAQISKDDDSESLTPLDPKDKSSIPQSEEDSTNAEPNDPSSETDSETDADKDNTDIDEDVSDPSKPTEAGWFKDDKGNTYYYSDPNSDPLIGWQEISGKRYYLDPSNGGVLKIGVYEVEGKYYATNSNGALYQDGWCQLDKTWYYANSDGSLKTGWLKTGGKWYHLDSSEKGAMKIGKYKVGSKWYISSSSGAMYASRWVELGDTWYYANSNGSLKTKSWIKSSNKWYYLDSDAAMATNTWVKSSSKWYYLKSDGVMATSGWVKDKGTWYYVNKSGVMQTGWLKTGGKWYYLNGSGAMETGWVKSGGKWYYLSSSGAMQTGWEKVDGIWYYLNSSGAMQTGWEKVSGKWYYLNSSGEMQTGWIKSGGKWYYLSSSGAMISGGWHVIGDKLYQFNTSGAWTGREHDSSNMASNFVTVALGEPNGRPEGGDNNKYNNYSGADWCAYFVVWCAEQAGVPNSVIPRNYLCYSIKSWYKSRGLWHSYKYTPKPGDLIFYSTYSGGSPSHIGIVTDCYGGYVYTKEGNNTGGVIKTHKRPVLTSYITGGWYIVGYASPQYLS